MLAAEGVNPTAVQVGYGGVFQVGRWTPVTVTASDANEVSVSVADADSRPVVFPLTRQSDGRFRGEFQSGRLDAPLRVITRTAAGEGERIIPVGVADGPRCLRQSTQIWLAVDAPDGFRLAAETLNATADAADVGPRVEFVSTAAAELPSTAIALDGVQVVIVGTAALSAEQSAVVRDWVQRGGRLVLAVGRDPGAHGAGPLALWLPVEIRAAYTERQTAALTGQITAAVPNKGILRSLDPLSVAELRVASGVVLIQGPTAPVAVRAAYGLGTVTVIGVDLDAPPFVPKGAAKGAGRAAVWGGLPLLCAGFATASVTDGNSPTERDSQLAPTGVSDFASQLAGIMDHFPDVTRTSNWNVIGLLAIYLLLVGPIDYLLVHRMLRRPQLTWVTLPMWVLLASWWATSRADEQNGAAVLTRQIELFDAAADTGVQRTSAWFSLYSPETRRHDVAWRPDPAPATADIRLIGLSRPEPGFRGMYRRGGIALGGAGYRVTSDSTQAAVLQSPVDQWSSLAYSGTAYAAAEPTSPPLAVCRQAVDASGGLQQFEITHHLPGALEDWFVVQRLEAMFPMPGGPAPMALEPGVPCNLMRGCGQKLLKAYIQGELTTTVQRKTGVDTYIRSDVYDPLGLDPLVLFRALSFHEAIGGREYTGLSNQTLGRLDLSTLVHLDRVILFGRLQQPAARFSVDGAPVQPQETATFVRLLIPITREAAAPVVEKIPTTAPSGKTAS